MNKQAKDRTAALFAGVESTLPQTDPEFVEVFANFSQGEVIRAGSLSERERFLCILAALLGCQGLGEYRNMLHAALGAGVEPVAIKEELYQATAYLGIGRTHDFLLAANEVLAQHGVALPLAPRAATDEATRFEQGLAKQVALFGPGMAQRQTNCPPLRRNVNRWLAANCFGDYYTRDGLNDCERELITFCFLLAQGGCENQLRGHTAANFALGSGPAKLYSVVEQCLPYIGYPRSLNAMNIIDEVAAKCAAQ